MVPDGQSCRAKSSCYLQSSHGAGSGTVHFPPLSPSTISLISGGRGYPRSCASSKRTASGPPVGVVALEMWWLMPPQTFSWRLLGISLLVASSNFWFPTGGGSVFEQLLHKQALHAFLTPASAAVINLLESVLTPPSVICALGDGAAVRSWQYPSLCK